MTRQPRLDLEPLLLRGGEVAEILGCSRSLAFRWMAANVLPVVRVPGSRAVRVPKKALEEWVQAHTEKPRGAAAS
jgi:excisionase family DNA binding protein